MSSFTPSQAGVVDELIEAHGEGQVVQQDKQGIVYSIGERTWLIGPRGKLEELQAASGSSGEVPPTSPEDSAGAESERAAIGASDSAVATEPPVPPSTDLAIPEDQRVYQALTAADERQIIAEIEGRAIKAMVYSFPSEGGRATGLSWKGVQEAVRQMNTRHMGRINIADRPPIFEEIVVDVDTGRKDSERRPILEKRPAVRVQVYARDEVYGSARWGTATQLREFKSKTKKDKAGNPLWFPDQFADAKALSKAQRNAMEGMLPLELVEELKALYIGKGSVEYIEGSAVDITDLPPALDDERAKQLGDEIRALYADFKQAHPHGLQAMPPAEFNRYFVAAQHSHERLEDFKAHMEQRLAEAKGEADG